MSQVYSLPKNTSVGDVTTTVPSKEEDFTQQNAFQETILKQQQAFEKMIQTLREENTRILENERKKIVQEVFSTLGESGVFNAKKTPPSSKIETSLQRLLGLSLEEEGLKFPHLTKEKDTTPLSPGRLKRNSDAKQVILMRTEFEERDIQERLVVENSNTHVKEVPRKKKLQKKPTMASSPLGKKSVRFNQVASTQKKKVQRKKKRESNIDETNIDEKYYQFSDNINAVLDRGRRLIKESPIQQKKKIKKKIIKISNEEDEEENETQIDKRISSKEIDVHEDKVDEATNNKNIQENIGEIVNNSSNNYSILPSSDLKNIILPVSPSTIDAMKPASTQSNESYSVRTSQIVDVDRPISTPPENLLASYTTMDPLEWENELARQIITLYTSKQHVHESNTEDNKKHSPSKDSSTENHESPYNKSKHATDINVEKKSRNKTNCLSSWEGSYVEGNKVVINIPKIPSHIWFSGSGTVKAIWCRLACPEEPQEQIVDSYCLHSFCEELRTLEVNRKFDKYLAILEALISARIRSEGAQQMEKKLWKQLVVTANAFSSRCIENKNFNNALSILNKAEELVETEVACSPVDRMELKGFIWDTYAYYYYRRGKYKAGLKYAQKAAKIHERREEWGHLAKCYLHIGNLLTKTHGHNECIAALSEILMMVEDQRLEEGGASGQKICMVAICYHNLAVEQLHLEQYDEACISSQNSRRLARLSLSYSNRWISQLEQTHKTTLAALGAKRIRLGANASESEKEMYKLVQQM